MNESRAWWQQALADWAAAERERKAVAKEGGTVRCHAVAKYQQTVEKAIKSLVTALREAGCTNVQVGRAHGVSRFTSLLVRLPRGGDNRAVQRALSDLLNPVTRAGIQALESLAPQWPAPGEAPQRNTEYPFQNDDGEWTFPAAESVFTAEEVEQFRSLASRIRWGTERVLSAIRRAPRA